MEIGVVPYGVWDGGAMTLIDGSLGCWSAAADSRSDGAGPLPEEILSSGSVQMSFHLKDGVADRRISIGSGPRRSGDLLKRLILGPEGYGRFVQAVYEAARDRLTGSWPVPRRASVPPVTGESDAQARGGEAGVCRDLDETLEPLRVLSGIQVEAVDGVDIWGGLIAGGGVREDFAGMLVSGEIGETSWAEVERSVIAVTGEGAFGVGVEPGRKVFWAGAWVPEARTRDVAHALARIGLVCGLEESYASLAFFLALPMAMIGRVRKKALRRALPMGDRTWDALAPWR